MKNNVDIFPTTIKYIKKFISKEECNEIIKYCKNIKLYNHLSLIGDAKSNHGKGHFILNNINKNIYKKILNETHEYVDNIGLNKVIINNSWVNFQKNGSRLDKHCHPDSVVSGVIYLKTDINSSKIYFYNPNPLVYFLKVKETKKNNYEYVYFKPEIGDLIIFPSWLIHGSNNDINKSKERIALSFNTKYEIKK